jgi:ATP-dependent Clp protease ATP-binding subunit ClpC
MFEKFSDSARNVIINSQAFSKEFDHSYLGTEHVLLSIESDENSEASKMLAEQGIDLERTKKVIIETVGRGDDNGTDNKMFSKNAREVFDKSVAFAMKVGSKNVVTDHIFAILIDFKDCMGYQILEQMDVDFTKFADIFKGKSDPFDNPDLIPNKEAAMTAPRKKRMNKSALELFGKNMTEQAKEGKLDPVIDRENEIERIVQILARRTKNNPVLVGEPGVGKTAVVEGLAQRIVGDEVPSSLQNKEVWEIDLGQMVAGTRFRGDFEERIKILIGEIKQKGNVIMFLDEIHTIVGGGGAEGSMDASNLLKPDLARSEFQVIGATTSDEFRKYFERDSALERRFQSIEVREPSVEATIKILNGLKPLYEAYHGVTITEKAVELAANLSSRYIQDRFLPDKAIDLIDEAAARVKTQNDIPRPELQLLKAEIDSMNKQRDSFADHSEYEKAATARNKLEKLQADYNDMAKKIEEDKAKNPFLVNEEVVADVLSMMTGIPVPTISSDEKEKLNHMQEELHKRVIGQDEAIETLSRTLKRSRVGLSDPKRPNGSFIFAGPTGVGKTELAKTLASFLFGTEDALIRIDMSEFKDRHDISRLIGSTPGFVGYEEGGQLTNAVRKRPYSIILFDEIEKAHPDIFNTLLQVLDDGRLTDGQGRTVDFKNTIIIMTTNIGSQEITKSQSTGFSSSVNTENNYKQIKGLVNQKLKDNFRPEFLNRLDDIVVFKQLDEEQVRQIAKLMMQELERKLKERDLSITYSKDTTELLAKKGFDKMLGARPIRRLLQREVEDELASKILNDEYEDGDTISISTKEKEFVLN